jgi:hypothetical protein
MIRIRVRKHRLREQVTLRFLLVHRKDHRETNANVLECELRHLGLAHLETMSPKDLVEILMRYH